MKLKTLKKKCGLTYRELAAIFKVDKVTLTRWNMKGGEIPSKPAYLKAIKKIEAMGSHGTPTPKKPHGAVSEVVVVKADEKTWKRFFKNTEKELKLLSLIDDASNCNNPTELLTLVRQFLANEND